MVARSPSKIKLPSKKKFCRHYLNRPNSKASFANCADGVLPRDVLLTAVTFNLKVFGSITRTSRKGISSFAATLNAD
jgi:hypothetical protein